VFITPEASKALNTYLGYRERYGETLTPKSPLFRDQFDRNDPDSIHNVKPLKLRAVERLIARTIEKSGLTTVERQTELQHNEHGRIRKEVRLTAGFRKFFDTQLIYANVRPAIKELFMGHSIGLDDNYFKPSENDVLEEYLAAVDWLTINEEHTLKKQVIELTKKQDEIEIMKKRHKEEMDCMREEMNQRFNNVITMIQQNPVLAQVKPESLIQKRLG
jgi:hypothetical protein